MNFFKIFLHLESLFFLLRSKSTDCEYVFVPRFQTNLKKFLGDRRTVTFHPYSLRDENFNIVRKFEKKFRCILKN